MTRADRILTNVPDGMQPVMLARLVEERLKAKPDAAVSAVFIARDGRRLQRMSEILEQLLPGHTILTLPAWDCLPYDRVSPNGVTIAARMTTLSSLASEAAKGAIVLTAVNALLQKLPPLLTMEALLFRIIWAGFVLLTLTLASGVVFSEELFGKAAPFNHKTVFGVVSWLIFAALLAGRRIYGWRGRIAVRWTLAGFLTLVLAYIGSKFVVEVVLGR